MMSTNETMQQAIEATRDRHVIEEHAYFRALASGRLDREAFLITQVNFLEAVAYFSRPMMALAARIPDGRARWPLIENSYEEHGEGSMREAHERTFLELLERLGVATGELDRTAHWPGVRAFNNALMGTCASESPWLGMAALGMIEDLFSQISGELGRAIVARGWLEADQLIHYGLHEVLDVEHAEAFYAPLRERYEDDPDARRAIDAGLALGAHMLWWLYDELLASAKV